MIPALVFLFGRVALAQVEAPPALADAQWGGRLSGLGGVDAWSGVAGLAGADLRGFGWTNLAWERAELSAGYAGHLGWAPGRDLAWLDGHRLDLRVGRGGARPHGAWVLAEGGALGLDPWAAALAGAQLVARSEVGVVQAGLAAGGAMGAEGPIPEVAASLSALKSGRRVWLGARAEARALGSEGGLAWVPEAALWARESAGSRLTFDQSFNAGAVVGTTATALPGLPMTGAGWLAGAAGVELRLAPAVTLRIEAAAERGLGDVDYWRARGLAGLVVRGQAAHRRPAWWAGPDGIRLFLRAPEAAEVEVLCSCVGWEPVRMTPGTAGWWTVVLQAPAGEHEYVYRVDGAIVLPPESSHSRRDDFGGENGVMVVP